MLDEDAIMISDSEEETEVVISSPQRGSSVGEKDENEGGDKLRNVNYIHLV